MAIRDKQKKKNPAGFTERQLRLLLNYCYATRQNPRMTISRIHKDYSSYLRRKSTTDIINKAYAKKVINGPILFVNSGIEVCLMNDVDNPREFFENCKKDEKTTLAFVSHGYWPIFLCKRGANTLQYHDSILPNNGCISDKKIENIFFEEKGTLPIDLYPHKWFEEQWNTYYCMKYPRNLTYREAEKKLGINWVSVREYFLEILKQCKIVTNFFPLGTEAYSPLLATLKTDYETGIVKGLKTLNRTTYLYKADNTIIFLLCVSPKPREQNYLIDKFQRLEEMGLIRDLHFSTPYDWHKAF
ncbi:MAG: hypothetical protein HXS48_09730 [Theionarchaea archaeon]|nr:hypothetical protein [Theionarchaea archaeon]